jgi:hypothetical protein
MKARFISRYGKLAGNSPTTAQPRFKRPAAIGGGTTADDGSTGQAEEQIAASPMPFQNPRAAANLPAPAVTQQQRRQLGGMSAGGTKPRPWQSAQANSEPMNHGAMMSATGHPPGYAPKQGYSPIIGGRLKPGRTRVMRGAVAGSKPLVSPMSDDDFSAGMKSYQKQHGRL